MNLQQILEQRGIPYRTSTHRATYTAQRLAEEEHVSGRRVSKPVVVKGQGGFSMCVLAAPDHVDLRRVAEALNEKDVRLATEDEMQALFPDCELGAEPPVGSLFGMKTVMDEHLLADDSLIMQAGSHTEAVELRRADWQEICAPQIAAIARQ